MLRPTPEEVLKSISYTFDTLIRPDPAGAMALSYSLTVSNMLRHLLLTMQHEEAAITGDTGELRQVLDQALRFLNAVGGSPAMVSAIKQALDATYSGPAPAKWARENWRALRGTLQTTIEHLQGLRDQHGKRDDYRAARQAMRDYLDRSLERERILIDGAFTLARR